MLVFDTAAVPVRERADAVSSAMLDATLSTNLAHHDPSRVRLVMEAYTLGPVALTRVATSGMDTTRTPRRMSSDEEPTIALTLGMTSAGMIEQGGLTIGTQVGVVSLVELTQPYFSRIPDGTDGWSVKIPLADLALPRAAVERARTAVAASPLHRLFAEHLASLGHSVVDLDAESAALTGAATTALARALICSATGRDDQHARESLADTLLLRTQAHVRGHLGDRELCAATIAAAHHVSVRHLYKTFAAAGLQLEQWIIEQRLDAARRDLRLHGVRHRTIAATARRWGFADPSHFTRRFRERYGVTPSEWAEGG
jgi:AraC-like DNA-binding protein